MKYKRSRFTITVPINHDGQALTAIHHTLTGASMLVPAENWARLIENGGNGADEATLEHLCGQGFLVKSGTDETAVYENWKQQHVYDSSTIKSRIIVTRRCNCACRYCLIDKEGVEMSPDTAKAMDHFYFGILKERKPAQAVDEAGGAESTLNWQVLAEVATRRYHFCQGLGIPYEWSMVTNGTLIDRPMIEKLKETGLSMLRVSIAGPAPIHDALRPFAGGGETYGTIMRKLASVSGVVKIMVECQYDSGSTDYETIPAMMDDLERYGIEVSNIRFSPILPTRNGSAFRHGLGDPQIYIYLTRKAQKRGYARFDATPSNRCAAEFRYHYVFDADGSIIPCPGLQCGEMAYGDVFRGVDFIAESQILKRKLPQRCLDQCELLPLCMGGCRLQALAAHQGFQGVDCRYDTLRLLLEAYIEEKAGEALTSN